MRVAIVQESLDPARGGAETSTREMAAALALAGCRVTVIHHGASAESADSGDFDQLALPPRGAHKLLRSASYLRRAAEAARGFDIVHAIAPLPGADVYQPRGGLVPAAIEGALRATRRPALRALKALIRRLHLRQRWIAAREAVMLRRPGVWVAAVSKLAAAQVSRHFPSFPPERLRVVFNGVGIADLDGKHRMSRGGALDEAPELLFVAHNFALKGLPELLAALAEPCLRGVRLRVVGRDAAAPYVRFASRRGVADRVVFSGAATDMPALYAASRVLVHPTWYDPCSRVVLEALRHGLPCVTTRFNGAAEAIHEPCDGRVVDRPDDPAELGRAIMETLSISGRPASGRDDLSMTRHAWELIALYEEILNRKRTG